MIQIENVTVSYQAASETTIAVDDVSLSIGEGELVGVVGPSGSGKSTLLAVMGGLLPATSGAVRINDKDMATMNIKQRSEMRLHVIGFVAQEASLLPGLTALENVAISAELQGKTRKQSLEEATEMMASLGIGNFGTRFPSELSGGQRHRVSVARGLVGGRKVLLVDEPTAALDSQSSAHVLDLLEHAADMGTAVAVATHDDRVIKHMSRNIHLRDGRLIDA